MDCKGDLSLFVDERCSPRLLQEFSVQSSDGSSQPLIDDGRCCTARHCEARAELCNLLNGLG